MIADLIVSGIALAIVFVPILLGAVKKNKNKSCYENCEGNCQFCYKNPEK
ncbi:MAG: hypothetical protein LBI55_00085 [Oscillospiraceae bacterium]|jgi:hypothetical protein|nr:hypothetical protein [Oscillospiraceae bacterium]